MDVSKLPRLSQTAPLPSPVPAPPAAGTPADIPGVGVPPGPAIPAAGSYAPAWCRKCHAPNAPNSRFCASCGAGVGGETGAAPVEIGAEAWISVGLGVLLLFITPRLLQYLSHVAFGTFFSPYLLDGKEVPYTAQMDFWSDLGITLFALVLILDGIILFAARKTWLVATAFALTVAATVYNFGYLLTTFSSGIALISALAVLFGAYMAVQQWRILQRLRTPTL